MKPIIFCDFDGTVTEKDNIISLMKQFAPPEWNAIKDQVLAREISVREGVGNMFSLIPSDQKQKLIDFITERALIREGFDDFVSYVKNNKISFYIVSGGIDFFVHPLLNNFVPVSEIFCNSSDFTGKSIKIQWPHACDEYCKNDCGCCKPTIMRRLCDENSYKIVIGDSVTDLEAAKQADFVLARDYLEEKCRLLNIPYTRFDTFYDCIDALENLLGVK